MKQRHSLSVIIIARDEADRIRPCLESVRDLADEIIVLDSGSADDTVAICREYTDLVEITDWPGDGPQKQRALERATCEWVFRIDADERLSPELGAEVAAILDQETIPESAFRVRWTTWFFGEYLTHGEAGAAHLNLFRREGARYTPGASHSRLLPAHGRTGKLKGRLLHHPNRDFGHLLLRLDGYAVATAEEMAERGEGSGLARAWIHACWRFLKIYLVQGGILDGRRGFLMATLYGHYAYNKYAALWVAKRSELH